MAFQKHARLSLAWLCLSLTWSPYTPPPPTTSMWRQRRLPMVEMEEVCDVLARAGRHKT